ncbi:hypothetical protein [Serinicoccus sp. LYQ131]|uniref:hypothetical protein n=1 Tax=Serinicoccus sp. LYQ131 TaxID=3378797 RepID=UPI003851880B
MNRSVLYSQVVTHLKGQGWLLEDEGERGTLWRHEWKGKLLSVPYSIETGTIAWVDLMKRLGTEPDFESRLDLSIDVKGQPMRREDASLFNDVIYLKVSHDLIHDTVPLQAGARLIDSAARMLRTCATTAMGPMPRIKGHYRASGDNIASRIRMGHSMTGSYAIPIYVPVDTDPLDPEAMTLVSPDNMNVRPEPATRRVSRIFSESLHAVSEQVKNQVGDPSTEELLKLVATGVTREFVTSLTEVIENGSVAQFTANYRWASIEGVRQSLPQKTVLRDENIEALEGLSKALKHVPTESSVQHVGRIIGFKDDANNPPMYLEMQVAYNGRLRNVRVDFRPELRHDVLQWLDAGTTIRVVGRTTTPAHITNAKSISPLSDSQLSI